MKNVFIIGSKGIPAKYGGFETFVDELTRRQNCKEIKYHVSCMSEESKEFSYNGVRCFNVKVPNVGSSKAVLYDILSLKNCIRYIKENNIDDCIVYILACRIGPFFSKYKKELEKLGAKVLVNPDGHEWKRSKWSYWVKRYWKLSERLMVKNADLLVCDSKGIQTYIKREYSRYSPQTKYIAYGADTKMSSLKDNDKSLLEWYSKFSIKANNYYLIVGRFVPENNYELIIKEFMRSETNKDLVIITNVEENEFYNLLKKKTNFLKDSRIKFVGTVYNSELLKKIREQAFAYIHGHEVGGTNPSLLEALASTKVNILLDVVFNREVGSNGALYYNKKTGNLSSVIYKAENFSETEINELKLKARTRIEKEYSWIKIVNDYENLFLSL